jgi:hypothetical protein
VSGITLALTSPHMTGTVVEAFQGDLNDRIDAWGAPKSAHVAVDGDFGMESRDRARSVLYGLGVDAGNDFDGVSPADRTKIRHGYEELTKDEKERHNERADWRKRFVEQLGGGGPGHALAFARAHIGVTEHPAGSNTGPEIDPWEAACGVHAAPWCGCFANACLVAAGLPNTPWLRYCPSIEANAKAGSFGWTWHTSGPAIGDLVLYGAREADHVELVEEVTGGGQDTSTIGGNTSNGPGGSQSNGGIVARRHRHSDGSLAGFPIRGYARPPWKEA